MKGGIAILLLAGAATALRTEASPVAEVIQKLKNIEADLEKSMKDYKDTFEHIKCWCKNNDREKTKEIAEAETKISNLNASIEKNSALSAKLSAEIANTKKELAQNIKALQDATALREKELAGFNDEEKAMLVYIKQLEDALVALADHEGGVSLVKLNAVVASATGFGAKFIHQDDVDNLKSLVQEHKDYFDAAGPPGTANSHNSRSNVIIGILKNMKEEFRSKLEESQAGELQAQKNFEELKATKTKEIELGQETVDKKTKERAETNNRLASDKQALEDTRNLLSASNKYLMDLKTTCQDTDQQWETQQKAVNDEMKAVREAINILDSDSSQSTFSKNFNFIQISENKRPINLAAMRVRLNAFAKVKKQIDTLIADLKQQQKDEDAKADSCVQRIHENESADEDANRLKDQLKAQRAKADSDIMHEEGEIETNLNKLHELKVALEAASQQRKEENSEYQINMANAADSIQVLNRALTVLQNHFRKGKGNAEDMLAAPGAEMGPDGLPVSFLQAEPVGPPPPAAMPTHAAHSGAEGVLALIKDIVNDCKTEMAEMKQNEKDQQADYDTMAKQTQDNQEAEERAMANNQEQKAEAEERFQTAEKDLQDTNNKLENLSMENEELHKECDYLLNHGEERKAARQSEIQSLQQAKQQLSGMDLGKLMADKEFREKHGVTAAVGGSSYTGLAQTLISRK